MVPVPPEPDDFDALALPGVVMDAAGRVVRANPAASALFGTGRFGPGLDLDGVVHPDDRETLTRLSHPSRGDPTRVELRVFAADGTLVPVRLFTRVRTRRESTEVVVLFQELVDEQHAEMLKNRFEAALDNSADVIVFSDPVGSITYANHAAQSYLAGHGNLADLFDSDSRVRLEDECLPQTYADGFWAGELALLLGETYTVPVNAVLLAHSDQSGDLEYLSLVAHDIAILKEAQRALEEQATHDSLTGLPNRSFFLELLRAALVRIDRSGEPIAVMFSDLDGFKAVNDGLGHDAGDELLIEVGRRMQQCLRESDIVARFGGDEFVILLEAVGDLDTAQLVADRIMEAIERPIALSGGEGRVGASIGISIASESSADPEALLAEADTAMYRAKQLGKRRHQLFDADLRARASARQSLLVDLEGAVDRGEFTVMYTPVVAARDGLVSGVESGLRWLHRKRGTLGVGEVLPLARELGIVLDLNRMLMRDVAQKCQAWVGGTTSPTLTTWVTIGPQEVLRGELDGVIAELADEFGLPPNGIGVEIPLEVLSKHADESERLCHALGWMGVRIAIDDFGSLPFVPSQFQRFHVDTVKLDRRFVRTLSESPEAISALSGIVALARALGVEVVAKGVERREEVELLQEVGCTGLQGPIVNRPLPAARLESVFAAGLPWLASWPNRVPLSDPMSRPQIVERLLRLRKTA